MTDHTEAPLETRRQILQNMLDQSRAEGFRNTIQSEASAAAARALEQNKADSEALRRESAEFARRAVANRAAAKRIAEMLAELPAPEGPATAPVD